MAEQQVVRGGRGARGRLEPGRRRRRWQLRALVCATVAATALGAAPAVDATAATPPVGASAATTPLKVAGASPDLRLQDLFDNYAQTGQGWTGADSTYSVPLPGGRDLWLFSDTFLGPIGPGTTRPASAAFIHNSFVLQRGNHLSTIDGGTPAAPTANVSPSNPNEWYWSGDGLVDGNTLQVMYLEFKTTGTGAFDFTFTGDAVATFNDRTLRLESVHPLATSVPDLEWGSWLQYSHGYTYIYGTEDLGANKYLHVARVRGHNLLGAWSYYAGAAGWSSSPTASARLMDGVGNEFSVIPFEGRWLMVTQDTEQPFSSQILGYTSPSPTGPFTDPTVLYTTPQTGPDGTYHDPNVYTYNFLAHPELTRGDRLVLSYNVNSLVSSELYANTTIYRPRFVDVSFRPAPNPGRELPHGHRATGSLRP